MRYAKIFYESTVDGEGVRTSLYVSGCRVHCKNCHNEKAWDFNYGDEFTDIEISEILESMKPKFISGLSILGGEPFEEENQPAILRLMKIVKKAYPDKTIWIYSGYYKKDLEEGGKKFIKGVTDEILKIADVLVDGPFISSERDISLSFRGSGNQSIIRLK